MQEIMLQLDVVCQGYNSHQSKDLDVWQLGARSWFLLQLWHTHQTHNQVMEEARSVLGGQQIIL